MAGNGGPQGDIRDHQCCVQKLERPASVGRHLRCGSPKQRVELRRAAGAQLRKRGAWQLPGRPAAQPYPHPHIHAHTTHAHPHTHLHTSCTRSSFRLVRTSFLAEGMPGAMGQVTYSGPGMGTPAQACFAMAHPAGMAAGPPLLLAHCGTAPTVWPHTDRRQLQHYPPTSLRLLPCPSLTPREEAGRRHLRPRLPPPTRTTCRTYCRMLPRKCRYSGQTCAQSAAGAAGPFAQGTSLPQSWQR